MDIQAFDRRTTCCFTGHRPGRLPSGWQQDAAALAPLRCALDIAIEEAVCEGFRTFLCGMALGTDTMAAQLVLTRREAGQPLCLVAVLPCPGQDARWHIQEQREYRRLLSLCDKVHIIEKRYTPHCMGARNLWMTEHSARLIAIYDGGSGGTGGTVAHAQRQGLELILIDPAHPERVQKSRSLFCFSK